MDSEARPPDDDATPAAQEPAASPLSSQEEASTPAPQMPPPAADPSSDQTPLEPPSGDQWAQAPTPPPSYSPSGAYPGSAPAPRPDDSRTWALGAHVSALLGGFLGGLPAFVGPLVVWLTRRDTDPFAAEHGREALNFNLSVVLYAVVLVVVTVFTLGIGLILSLPLGIALGFFWLAASVIAAVKAGNGEPFRYPLTIPFVS